MFQLFIDGEEMVYESEFTINEEFMNPSSLELYKVYPKSWKGTDKLLTDYYFPEDYTKCKILKGGELYFTGITKNSDKIELNPFKPHYCSLQILDPSTLLSEGKTLEFVIVNKTVTEAIEQVIDNIKEYGFVVGNISIPEIKNTVIGAYSTLDKAPYDVFQYLANISESRWGTRMIDENTTAIDFYSPEIMERKGTIETTKPYCTLNKIINIDYDFSTTDYRNKQIITSDEVYANIPTKNTLVADGYTQTYILEQKIGRIKNITVNGVNKTFASKEEKELGISADFYYEVGSKELESEIIIAIGLQIDISYIAIIDGREIAYNVGEIQRIKGNLGRDGTISRYENRNDIVSSKELQAVGKSYIKYKGQAEIKLSIIAKKDFLQLGGKYRFSSPIIELNKDYIAITKKTNIEQKGEFVNVTYEYELSNNFDTENEINYFDNQRAKSNGNIEKGEFISRNYDIENTANIIFYGLTKQEIEPKGNNIFDCVIGSPFNN